MNDAEREIAAFLREEADSMEPTAGMYPRVLSRAKFRRVLTATIVGLAVLAIGVSGVVMATVIRPQAAIEPAVPEAPGVDITPIKDVFAQEVAVTDDSAWVNGVSDLYEIDPGSNEVIKTVREGAALGRVAAGEGAVWMTSWEGGIGPGGVAPRGKVVRVGLEELGRHEGNIAFEDVGKVIWRSGRNEAPEAVVTGFGSAWVAERVGDRVLRFSPEGSLLTEIPVGHSPVDVAAGFGGVWVVHTRSDPKHSGKGDASLLKIDPATESPSKPVPAGNCPHSVTTGASAVWVLDYCDEVVRKFDPETMQSLGGAYLPSGATGLAVGDGFLWTVHPEDGVVLRTDLEGLHQVGDPIRLRPDRDYGPSTITYGAGSIWVPDVKLFRLDVE